jgi:hypothetical protein
LKRLEGINRALCNHNNQRLINLRDELWKEYNFIVMSEENYWYQLACCKWINQGDLNTRFFHLTTLKRCRFNKIVTLQKDDESWIFEEDEIKDLIYNYFKNLYLSPNMPRPEFLTISTYPDLENHDRNMLMGMVLTSEVKEALFSMGNYKSPGPDGFHPIFFKRNWEVIGPSFCRLVQDCFSDPTKLGDINQTLITLIPKIEAPSKVSQFRPIALCNVSYKVISKIVAQRLRVIMPYVIAPNQSSFIPGRSTTDNILILQETIHTLNHLKGNKAYMVLKLDLEKAYDRIEWSFILKSIELLNIPENIISLIKNCMMSTSMNINWNGTHTNSFSASRGIRQGDPLSPYLFVIAIERLSHKIKDMVDNGTWKPLKFRRGMGPHLSHICFADDLVLIAEASTNQAMMIKTLMDNFCHASSQKINLSKSKVFFSNNLQVALANDISNILGVDETQDLGKYLGVPMLHQRINKNSLSFILDRMKEKLSNWKADSLSFAGRIALAQSSLASIPGYIMQTMEIPCSICDEAERLCRNFIWGSTNEQRKCHLISWEQICKPKKDGGLGFRNLRVLNKAYMCKLAWQLVEDKDKLWVSIIRAKYDCGPMNT